MVEEVEDNFEQINLKDAKKIDPNASLEGPAVEEELPPIDFGRVAAQSAKQVIVQKVRDAEERDIMKNLKIELVRLLVVLSKELSIAL